MYIVKNDEVVVIAGADKGKRSDVTLLEPAVDRNVYETICTCRADCVLCMKL